MHFSAILAGAGITACSGPDPEITGVEYDSRRVAPGALFVAMRGETVDGNRFIASALEKGAAAVLTDSSEAMAAWARQPEIAIAQAPHGRRALAAASANFFSHPEQQLAISGVTGTNGKTTTAFLLEGLLQHAARKTILIGTIECHLAGQVLSSPHTTPESRDLLDFLDREALHRALVLGDDQDAQLAGRIPDHRGQIDHRNDLATDVGDAHHMLGRTGHGGDFWHHQRFANLEDVDAEKLTAVELLIFAEAKDQEFKFVSAGKLGSFIHFT